MVYGVPFILDDLLEAVQHAIVSFGTGACAGLQLDSRLDHIKRIPAE